MCELLGRYQTREPGTKVKIPLQLPKGGTIEIVNSHKALPVNRYWILAIGPLGRFGERADTGFIQLLRFRQDLDEEREGMLPSLWIKAIQVRADLTQRKTFVFFKNVTQGKLYKKNKGPGSASPKTTDSSSGSVHSSPAYSI